MSPLKLRALVLEDEWAARNYLVELVEASGVATVAFGAADTEQAWAALRSGDGALAIDIAFVDIRIAGEPTLDAGVVWLRAASAEAPGLRFVMTTASREHALEAFELGVSDYLVKPFTAERVQQCLRRLAEQRPATAPPFAKRVVARDGKNLVFLPVDEVSAFEAAEGLSYVFARDQRYEVDLSLSALLASLGGEFLRVHRNWLVRLDAVRTFERDGPENRLVVGSNDLRVPVARDRATQVRDALTASAVGLRR